MVSHPLPDARAPSGAPHVLMQQSVSACSFGGVCSIAGPRFRLRPVGTCIVMAYDARLGSSASSWQGPIVAPGGAPAPPECLVDEPDPQATHPVPLHDAS